MCPQLFTLSSITAAVIDAATRQEFLIFLQVSGKIRALSSGWFLRWYLRSKQVVLSFAGFSRTFWRLSKNVVDLWIAVHWNGEENTWWHLHDIKKNPGFLRFWQLSTLLILNYKTSIKLRPVVNSVRVPLRFCCLKLNFTRTLNLIPKKRSTCSVGLWAIEYTAIMTQFNEARGSGQWIVKCRVQPAGKIVKVRAARRS
jgi:hypothetical protein